MQTPHTITYTLAYSFKKKNQIQLVKYVGSKFLLEAEMTKVSIKNLEYEKWIIRKDKCSHDTHRHCNRVRLEPSSCCVWYCWCWVFSMLFVAPHLVMLILSNYITNQSFHFLILFLFWVFFFFNSVQFDFQLIIWNSQ